MSETRAKSHTDSSEVVLPDSTSVEPDLCEDGAIKRKKETLGPWLWMQIDSGNFPGLNWLDTERHIFSIPWRHGKNSDWSERDTLIFKAWETHKGRYRQERDVPDYAAWKTRFRCALNRIKDIQPVKDLDCEGGSNPYRAFQFVQRADIMSQSPRPYVESTTPSYDILHRTGYTTPNLHAVVQGIEEVNITDVTSVETAVYEPDLTELRSSLRHTMAVVPDLSTIDKHDLVNIGDSLPPFSDISIDKSINSINATETNATETTIQHTVEPDLLDIDNKDLFSLDSQLSLSKVSFDPNISGIITDPMSLGTEGAAAQFLAQGSALQDSQPAVAEAEHGFQGITVPQTIPATIPPEMKVIVRFFEKPVLDLIIKSEDGCNIFYKDSMLNEFQSPTDWENTSRTVEHILIPFTRGMHPEKQDKHMVSLLSNMEQGLHIFSEGGDIYVLRKCNTRIYAALPGDTGPALVIERNNKAFKIFDYRNYFGPAFEQYKQRVGPKPSSQVILGLGQPYTANDEAYKNLLVSITVCHVVASQLLNEVSNNLMMAENTCDESMDLLL